MSHLIFDTETTGFPNANLPFSHPSQARVCQIALLVLDDKLNEVASFYSLIKPKGWQIPERVSAIHGITTSDCERYGLEKESVLNVFQQFCKIAKSHVAHNSKFDRQMMEIEFGNSAVTTIADMQLMRQPICTMLAMTPICKLQGGKFGNPYKWPKLQEAYSFLFKEQFDGAHDALADVRATAKVFKWLAEKQLVPTTS